jgi:hypothetical protein
MGSDPIYNDWAGIRLGASVHNGFWSNIVANNR